MPLPSPSCPPAMTQAPTNQQNQRFLLHACPVLRTAENTDVHKRVDEDGAGSLQWCPALLKDGASSGEPNEWTPSQAEPK